MTLLELLIVVLLIAWLAGAVALPGTSAIHLLLLVVLVLVVIRLLQGRQVL